MGTGLYASPYGEIRDQDTGEVWAATPLRTHNQERADRIAACVNACSDLETESLEIVVDGGDTLNTCFDRIQRQRDDLLAALELVTNWRDTLAALPSFSVKGVVLEDMDDAVELVKKMKEET